MLFRVFRMLLLCLPVLFCAACKKKEEKKSSRRLREEALLKATAEHSKVKAFTDGVRGVFEWRQTQPATLSEADRRALASALAQRMAQVPAKDLPPDLQNAWAAMLTAWQSLAAQPQLTDAQRQQGARAAAELNRQLAAAGVIDLHF